VVLFDPQHRVLMVVHSSRQNIEQKGPYEAVKWLSKVYGCNPSDLHVWLSPAAGKENYPMWAFDNRSLQEVTTEMLVNAGVKIENIETMLIDTTKSNEYYSHSQGDKSARFAICAAIL
jgi:copper oxidase (laccase) domain-containing protein